jgi:hypothetical protein
MLNPVVEKACRRLLASGERQPSDLLPSKMPFSRDLRRAIKALIARPSLEKPGVTRR